MDEQGILLEILKLLQKKYSCMNRIFTTTNEMKEVLDRDDRVSLQLLITMRQDEFDEVDKCNRDIQMLVSNLPSDKIQKVQIGLKEGIIEQEDSFEYLKIGEITRNIKLVLEKAIVVDKIMSCRLAGKDSYYNQ